jgi:uncharacterized protein YlxP (DUF503 family)
VNVVALTWELRIPGCRSLKEKRAVVRSIRDRLRHHYHVSAAEVGLQDVHDRAEIAAVFVTSDGRAAQALASRLEQFVDDNGRALVIRRTREER